MSSLDPETGRSGQKRRTRQALLDAAARLLGEGRSPSVAEVADAAGVSRATAYRYFPSQDAMLLEAGLAPSVAPPDRVVPDTLADPGQRAAAVQRYLFELTRDNEPAFRAFMAAILQESARTGGRPAAALRGNRRGPMLERALAPLDGRLDPQTRDRLAKALAGMVGLEAYVALTDVAGLDPDEARETMAWAIETLVRAVVREASAPDDA